MVTVAIVGSRTITADVAPILDAIATPAWSSVVSGGAIGTDAQAARWARARGLPVVEHLPDYGAHGRHAPHVRNRAIVDACDLLVAFWDADPWPENARTMVARARRRGVPVVRVAAGRVLPDLEGAI